MCGVPVYTKFLLVVVCQCVNHILVCGVASGKTRVLVCGVSV